MTHSRIPATPPAPPGLDHLSIPVTDLDRSLSFYRDVLGMTLAWREGDTVLVKAGGSDLALNRSSGALPARAALHFGFQARSLEEVGRWKGHLESHGVRDIRLVQAPGVAQLYFKDPDEYTLEIYYPGA